MDESDTDDILQNLFKRIIVHSTLTRYENGNILLNKLKGLVKSIQWSPQQTADLFDALLKRFQSKENERSHFFLWMMQMLHCIEINYVTPSWTHQDRNTSKTLMELVRDDTITDEELKSCLADDKEKELDEILEEIRQEKLNQIDEKLLSEVRDIVSSVHKDLVSHNDGSQLSGLKRDLLKLCRAVEKIHFRPRLTQMVSWCIMALSDTGRLIQVGTGEGKSCIVAMFAAFRAMRGEYVDIMSSSPELVKRDLGEWEKFYKALKITVSCNTNKQGKDLKSCYQCKVVYGTVEEFAGDWLHQHFLRKDIFGERKFQCAIADEVDSLMLDKGHHVVYISSDMPALQHLNPLLASIWATVNQYKKIGTDTWAGPKYLFHEVVLKYINTVQIFQIAKETGILANGLIRAFRQELRLSAKITIEQLVKFFRKVETQFPSCQFALHRLNSEGAIEELNIRQEEENGETQRVALLLSDGGFCQYMFSDEDSVEKAAEEEIKRTLHFTPCELSDDETSCYVPGFLSELVKSKLKDWIENAFYAQTMAKDHEYVTEKHGIVPVDYSCTGVVENFMKWSDGIQQFLEMKHGEKLSDMTAITNYMSNVGLLQMYGHQIFGISGTLGQQQETETLQKIYEGITTCQIPSFKRRKLFEVEGVIEDDEDEWVDKICDVVTAQTNPTAYRKGRAALVICETINRAKILHEALRDKIPNRKLYINNNMDNSKTIQQMLEAGDVIIATNLAGRGTDLKVCDSVNQAGGLFVVQTFLPRNARVEAQAFGRTARQGSPGSAQLIVCVEHLSQLLQLLVMTKKLLSLFNNITDAKPLYEDLFLMQLRWFQQSCRDSIDSSATLSQILSENSESQIKKAKKARDDLVAKRLTSYQESEIPKIKKKAELFSFYLGIIDEVYKSQNNKPADSELSALNEFWGIWLLKDFSENDSVEELKSRLSTDLNRARQKLQQRESPSSNLHHYTVFGNELRDNGDLAGSIEMYSKAIQEDHCWAAIAYYNRAFASLIQQNRRQDHNCLDQALQDLQNAQKSVDLYCKNIELTYKYSTQQTTESHSDSGTRFDSHIKARYTVLLFFKANIDEALKKVDKARDLGGNVKVEESMVYFLVPLGYFIPLAILSTESVAHIRSRDPLIIHQLISHPSFDIVNEIRCLESLGLTNVYTLDTLFSLGGFFSKIHRTISRALD